MMNNSEKALRDMKEVEHRGLEIQFPLIVNYCNLRKSPILCHFPALSLF